MHFAQNKDNLLIDNLYRASLNFWNMEIFRGMSSYPILQENDRRVSDLNM